MRMHDQLITKEQQFIKWLEAASTEIQQLIENPERLQGIQHSLQAGFYNYLLKSTVRIPHSYRDDSDRFFAALQNYILELCLEMYSDGLRIARWNNLCFAVFKNCGDELGGYFVNLKKDGNLVIIEAAYQTYFSNLEIASPLSTLKAPTSSAIRKTTAYRLYRKQRYFDLKLVVYWLSFCLIDLTGDWLSSGSCCNDAKKELRSRLKESLRCDLSSIYFPVKYFDQTKLESDLATNHDHLIFINRLNSIIERAVSLGEQTHESH
jgi:hypothetical protein